MLHLFNPEDLIMNLTTVESYKTICNLSVKCGMAGSVTEQSCLCSRTDYYTKQSSAMCVMFQHPWFRAAMLLRQEQLPDVEL